VFVELASKDQFGLKVKLPNGNVASRVLPVRIHDLDSADIKECESVLGGVLRGIEFIYKEPGVNKPLTADDDEKKNLNKTKYRLQINKVANAIDEIISGLKGKSAAPVTIKGKILHAELSKELQKKRISAPRFGVIAGGIGAGVVLIITLVLLYPKLFKESAGLLGGRSVALMSFRNLTGNVANDYLAETHYEALYQELGKVSMIRPELTVLGPRTTSFIEKNRMSGSEKISDGKADYLVEGNVLSSGDSSEIIVRLIAVNGDEKFVWAREYPVDLKNILKLHHNIAGQIARGIGLELPPSDSIKRPQPPQVNPQSYQAYSRGIHELEILTEDGMKKGLEYLREAVAISPEDPMANAGLAIGYLSIAHNSMDPGDALTLGEEYAFKAFRLDSTIAEVHAALAIAYLYRAWNFVAAEKHFKRALQINPNLPMAHYHYSWGLCLCGRMEEAIKEHKLAQKCDPYNPLHTAWLGGLYELAGRNEEAIQEATNSFKIQKDYPIGYLVLGRAYLNLGRKEEAIKMHEKLVELYPTMRVYLCITYIATGHMEEAEKILAEVEKFKVTPINAYNRARIYAALGKKDEAFKWLNYEPHWGNTAWAAVIREFNSLHDDVRWDVFLRKLTLPKK
jgi:tetratricopeptide (TPR) repeat protein